MAKLTGSIICPAVRTPQLHLHSREAVKYHVTPEQGDASIHNVNTVIVTAGSLPLSAVLKLNVSSQLPDNVIVVAQVKFLLVLPGVVHNSHTRDEIDNFLGGGVVQVVAALVSPVSVNPLQSQVAAGSSSVSHLRTSRLCLSVAVT